MPADEREEKEPHSSKRKRTEDPGEKHQVTKDAKVTKDDKVAEVPMQQQRMVREVSEDEDESKTSRYVSLTPLTNEEGLG